MNTLEINRRMLVDEIRVLSRKCLAKIEKSDEFGLVARVIKEAEFDKQLMLTSDSLNLRGKTHVFDKKQEKNHRHKLIIRDAYKSLINPGTNEQFSVIEEGIIIEGRIVANNNVLFFDYESFHAFTESGVRYDSVVSPTSRRKALFKNKLDEKYVASTEKDS